jgi:hypothetical protein
VLPQHVACKLFICVLLYYYIYTLIIYIIYILFIQYIVRADTPSSVLAKMASVCIDNIYKQSLNRA